jgi:hypothetical protein
MAIDPGGTTGVAIRFPDGTFKTVSITKKTDLYDLIRPPVQVCIYEEFQAQLISGYGLHTVRLVGAIEALCWKEGIKPVPRQPQRRKAYVNKAVALLHDLNQQYEYTDHEIDALAHLLSYEAADQPQGS